MRSRLHRGTLILASATLLAVAGPASAQLDTRGYLYGRVTTQSGNDYTGQLRWGNQEAFWDDLFNSSKRELPYLKRMEDKGRRRSHGIKIFRWNVRVASHDWGGGRAFISRFGDIDFIEVIGDDEADVHMKSGSVIAIDGGSDDVGGKIVVSDAELGGIELKWKNIERIQFLPTPAGLRPTGERLYGRLDCDAGRFEGYVQWDAQECLSTDELDGDSSDGTVALEMGRIRSIERRNRRSAIVELKDGRELTLDGSNDVNDDNRGIFVETEDQGRVRVYWDEFDRLEFVDAPGSGRGYDEYHGGGALIGTVTDEDGRSYRGRIVIDLDEAESWEILNGESYGVPYNLPLAMVARIEPDGRDGSRIWTHGGLRVELENGQDVGEKNAGVMIFEDGGDDPVFLEWEYVQSIELEPES